MATAGAAIPAISGLSSSDAFAYNRMQAEGRDEAILWKRRWDEGKRKQREEDAKHGIMRKRKKWTVLKQTLFGCGYEDEERIVPIKPVREEQKSTSRNDIIR